MDKGSIIAIDPGLKNLAYCVLNQEGEMLKFGLLTQTFDSLTKSSDFLEGNVRIKTLVQTEILPFLDQESTFVFERFVPRGMYRGNLTEGTNIVIGILISEILSSKKVSNTQSFLASQWKIYAKKHYGYVEPFNKTFPQHIVDAYILGLTFLRKNNNYSDDLVTNKLLEVKSKDWRWKQVKGVWVSPD